MNESAERTNTGNLFSRPEAPAATGAVQRPPPSRPDSRPEQAPARTAPPERRAGQPANVLGVGATFKGKLQVEDGVRVEGNFQGDLITGGKIEVAAGARFNGSIDAAFASIAGSFEGKIRCRDHTELLPGSKVQGDIVTRGLSVQDGAIFDGTIKMGEQEPGTPRAST